MDVDVVVDVKDEAPFVRLWIWASMFFLCGNTTYRVMVVRPPVHHITRNIKETFWMPTIDFEMRHLSRNNWVTLDAAAPFVDGWVYYSIGALLWLTPGSVSKLELEGLSRTQDLDSSIVLTYHSDMYSATMRSGRRWTRDISMYETAERAESSTSESVICP